MLKKIIFLLIGILFGMLLGVTIQQAEAFGFKDSKGESKSVIQSIQDNRLNGIQDTQNSGSKSGIEPYQETLKNLGSPYWDIDIKGYCEQAKLSWTQCKLLIGIAGSESSHGTQYVQTSKKGRRKNYEGGIERHNPVGLKRPSVLPHQPIPDCDAEGWCWWIYKFDSWDAFWKFYTQHMANTYLKNGASKPESLVRRYVGHYSQGWVNRVYVSMKDL